MKRRAKAAVQREPKKITITSKAEAAGIQVTNNKTKTIGTKTTTK